MGSGFLRFAGVGNLKDQRCGMLHPGVVYLIFALGVDFDRITDKPAARNGDGDSQGISALPLS